MIKCTNVCIEYAHNDVPVFEQLNICFETSNIYLIIGESGAGKSTLINAILGNKKPHAGTISYKGNDIYNMHSKERSEIKREIGYVSQNYSLIDSLTVLDNICIASLFFDKKRNLPDEREKANKLLEKFNIQHLKNISTGRISGGEKRRVEIARAFMKGEQVIIMDEPTNNLDDVSVDILKTLVNEYHQKGVLIIISTHDARMMDIPEAKIISVEEKNALYKNV